MARSLAWAALWAFVAACFVGWALHPPTNLDVDWYLLGARTLLGGDGILYVTIRDPNPPFVWQLFLANEALARWAGLPSHRLFYALSAAGCLALLVWTAALLPRRLRVATLLGGAFFGGFAAFAEAGQRDVFAALMMLPYLAWTQRLGDGLPARRAGGAAATFVAGLALLLKPHFLIYFVFAEALLAWRRRGLPGLRADLLWPLLGVALIGAAQLALYPGYLDYIRSYGAFYLDWEAAPVSSRALVAMLMLAAALGVAVLWRRPRGWAATLGWMGLAAVATALVQDKWWEYQAHPILLFAGLAWAALLAEPARTGWRGLFWASLAAPAVWFGGIALQSGKDHWQSLAPEGEPSGDRALAAAIDSLVPPGAPIGILGDHTGAVAGYRSHATWGLADPPFWVVLQVAPRRLAGEALRPVEAEAEAHHLADLAQRLESAPPALLAFYRSPGYALHDALAYYRLDARIAALLDAGYDPTGEVAGYDLFVLRP